MNLPNYSGLGNRESMIAIAESAQELGYSSLWTSDHILIPADLPEPFGNLLETFTTLSYLAARTETIRLATGILVIPQRDPLLVAKQAATLHHLSAGRFTLGLAVGWIAKEYSFLRTDFGNRGQLADEYIQAIRVLFESDHPEFHGEHINFSEALFSPRPKLPIPIVVGGTSKAALRRAAILGDGLYGLRLSPDATEVAIGTIDQIGHKPNFSVSLRVQTRVGGSVDGADPETTLHGDAEVIVEKLRRYREVGVQQLVIEPFTGNLTDFLEQVRLFAHEIAPNLPD
ncbi:MAG TPA: TIGR03619 family F420-dependent LLM class oxidoreductase [Candidatus Acidoferrum sp.]|nr:TIGR03619 family F420-dependent LLM class oxidoreductase [Candidatus Acidoferrum sp.]